jgi:putative transposase
MNRKWPFHLWAFVFMPKHVHPLLQPINGSEISRVLWAIKWPVTKKSVRHVQRVSPGFLGRMEDVQPTGKRAYRFWQRGGGHDRNIYSDSELIEKINYIHNNPVRRGLVDSPGDWYWSSWRAWHEGVDTPIRIDRASVFLR